MQGIAGDARDATDVDINRRQVAAFGLGRNRRGWKSGNGHTVVFGYTPVDPERAIEAHDVQAGDLPLGRQMHGRQPRRPGVA